MFATRPTLFHYIAEREALEKMARELFKVVVAGDVHVPITKRYKLADVGEAHRALEARETTGAAVLLP